MSAPPVVEVPAYAPCATCGQPVLTGLLASGEQMALDVAGVCYVIDWLKGTDAPRLHQSRAYPVHHCGNTRAVANTQEEGRNDGPFSEL
jgi:hypothetical protein